MAKFGRDLDRFLRYLVETGGSDLHIKGGATPRIRIDGRINNLSREIISPQAVEELADMMMSDTDRERFRQDQEVDFIYEVARLGRFRINVYRQMMGLAIAIRHVRIKIPTFEDLNLPQVLYSLISRPRGMVLVTGAAGSGKSTTLAAMIETLNRTAQLNIITIEDPVEFSFKEKKCTIQQREVGHHTPSWSEALRRIMRQDPDVIMLGEIRDAETMVTALNAANTGHLVLATMHTMDATQTINRVLAFMSTESMNEVRYLLSATLVGVVSLRLLPLSGGPGRIPAVEVLIATETVRKMLLDPEATLNIRHVIADGFSQYGMQTFDQSLMRHYRSGKISIDEALKYATSPTDFRIKARGIDGQTGLDWSGFEAVKRDDDATVGQQDEPVDKPGKSRDTKASKGA